MARRTETVTQASSGSDRGGTRQGWVRCIPISYSTYILGFVVPDESPLGDVSARTCIRDYPR